MKKFLGITWVDFVCILVAVTVAEMTKTYFQLTGFVSFFTWTVAWIAGYTITLLIIKQILKWTEKN